MERAEAPQTLTGRIRAHASAPLHKNAYALMLGSVSTALLGLVFWSLAARHYPVESVGIQAALISAMQFLAAVSALSLNNVLLRFLPVTGPATRRLIASAYAICACTGAIVALVFAAGTGVWSPALSFLRTDPVWTLAFVASTSVYVIFSIQDFALVGMRRAVWVPVENTLVSVVKIVVLLVLAGQFSGAGIFASWSAPTAFAVAGITFFVLGRFARTHIATTTSVASRLRVRRLARYAMGDYVGALMWRAAGSLVPIIVLNRLGAAASAYFVLPWLIFSALQFGVLAATRSLTVEGAIDRDRLRLHCQRMLVQMLGMLAPIVAVLVIAGPTLLEAFGGSYAAEGGSLLRWLAFASIPAVIVTLASSVARVQERPRLLATLGAAAAFPIIALSYVLLPVVGIVGVGIAAFSTYSVLSLLLLATTLRPLLFPMRQTSAATHSG
jgi:O-antigen/teichoic acid export membrane protein